MTMILMGDCSVKRADSKANSLKGEAFEFVCVSWTAYAGSKKLADVSRSITN
jgi:hypothetical protein